MDRHLERRMDNAKSEFDDFLDSMKDRINELEQIVSDYEKQIELLEETINN